MHRRSLLQRILQAPVTRIGDFVVEIASDATLPFRDMKALVRKIVTSAAYRGRSVTTPQLLTRDPENRLLARGPRFRLDFHRQTG